MAIPIYSGYFIDDITLLLDSDNTITFAGLTAGTGISVSGLQITNTGVTSLQGSTGALDLTAGTGISISGLTITNSGVTSLQGSTGALDLSAGNGISISGLTIAMSGSYSGEFDVSGKTGFGSGSLGLTSSNVFISPYSTSGYVLGQNISFVSVWGNVDNVGGFIGENYNSVQIGIFNRTDSTQGVLSGNTWSPFFEITSDGEVYTSSNVSAAIGTSDSINGSPRNILDDGSGNMTVSGNLTVDGSVTIDTNLKVNDLATIGGKMPAIILQGSNSGGVCFSNDGTGINFSIVASIGTFTSPLSPISVYAQSFIYNSGGGAYQYIVISDTPLIVGSGYDTVYAYFQLFTASYGDTDTISNQLFTGSTQLTIATSKEMYVYYAVGQSNYCHYLTSCAIIIGAMG